MSRKSSRKTSPAAPPPPPPPPAPAPAAARAPAGGMARRWLFIGTALALLLVFAAAALLYRSTQDSAAAQAAAGLAPALANPQAPRFGPATARVHIVEFLDPACETCAAFFPHVKTLMSAQPDKIRLTIRHVPFHRGADLVVRILEASRAQGRYLATLEGLYARQQHWTVHHEVQAERVWEVVATLGLDLEQLKRDMQAPVVAARMAQDMADAKTLGVRKTPEFFVNGRPLPRFGLEPLQDLVADELRRAYR